MKIVKDDIEDKWILAESEENLVRSRTLPEGVVPCDESSILIVDDEFLVRKVHEKVISTYLPQLTIHKAKDGKEGVEMFMKYKPLIVIMDLKMPIMDGETAFLEIQKICQKENIQMPSVVFCTAYDTTADIRGIVSEDPRHCLLRKPPTNQVFVKAITDRLYD